MAFFSRRAGKSQLKKYVAKVRGENYLIRTGDLPEVYGYYATRHVEAPDIDAAFDAAAAMIHGELDGKVLNAPGDAPLMRLDEIAEVKSFSDCHVLGAGFKWFLDNGGKRLEDAQE